MTETMPILEMPQPRALVAADMLKRAGEYLVGFKRLVEPDTAEVRHPAYFLLAHAIELVLKAHLVGRGLDRKRLRQLGHDVRGLLDEAEELGSQFPDDVGLLVASIGEMNFEHDFRYPTGYRLEVPYPRWCIEAMELLFSAVEPKIAQDAVEAQLRLAADTRHLKGVKIVWSD